ncbi:hypothetical protein LZC95_30800 [Pendulispora brunnea]|uniref:Uncharacterized protein n=1 Tax=Pendulispora brunnea TaxID=2905690 RepID=A0ABZ2K189_9BACT
MPNLSRTTLIFAAALTALSAAVACERTGREEQEKVTSAQREADKKSNEAVKESTTKITSAQAEVDKKTAEANANFVKTREDYRTKLSSKVEDIDKTIQKLDTKQRTATGKTKAELDAALPDIHSKRDALRRDMTQIDMVTMANWDGTKNQLDTDMDALKAALDKAPSVL